MEKKVGDGLLTALSIHFNQKGCHCDFTSGNGEVKEKDSDPCEEKEVVQLANFLNESDMVSQAVENRENTKDLCKHCEEL